MINNQLSVPYRGVLCSKHKAFSLNLMQICDNEVTKLQIRRNQRFYPQWSSPAQTTARCFTKSCLKTP